MNVEVLNLGKIGLGIKSLNGWEEALKKLINDDELRKRMGCEGRELSVKNFDINYLSKKLLDVIDKTYN